MPESSKTGKNPLAVHMTFRDWSQSSHGTNLSAEDMIEAMPNVRQYGIDSAELAGGTFGQLHISKDRVPFEFVGKLTDHVKRDDSGIEVTALLRNECGWSISRRSPDVLEHTIRRHAEIGVDTLNDFHHENDSFMMLATPHICKKLEDEGHIITAQANLTLQSNPDSMARKPQIISDILFEAEKMLESGHKGLRVKNANGVLYPDLIYDVITALKGNFDQPVGYHTHNAYGYGYDSALSAIDAGLDSIDALPHALAEGTAQLSIDKLVHLMERQGGSMLDRLPRVNLDAMRQDEQAAFAVRGKYSGFELPFDPELFEIAEASGSAGGALTSLMQIYGENLRIALPNASDKEILREILLQKADNRKDFGYLTCVTPTEDVQNGQAVGDVFGREVSKKQPLDILSVPTIKFYTGQLGKIPAGINEEVQGRALEAAGLDDIVTLPKFDELEPEMPKIRAELEKNGLRKPTDDEVSYFAMYKGPTSGFVDFAKRARVGRLDPKEPQLPRILDKGGDLEDYKGALFQIAYDLLDLHKIEIGHYEGADYHALHEKGHIIDVDDKAIDAAADRYEKVDLSAYAKELEQKISHNMQSLEQRLKEQGADKSLAFSAQKVIVRLASDIGVTPADIPRMDLTQFPTAQHKGPMFKEEQLWPESFAAGQDPNQGDSNAISAWEKAKERRDEKHPPELGVVTEEGDIEPRHPHHDEDRQDMDIAEPNQQ